MPFIKFHKLKIEEILEPLDSFKNFNEFFYRKLKPNARRIASEDPVRFLLILFYFILFYFILFYFIFYILYFYIFIFLYFYIFILFLFIFIFFKHFSLE